ncbi:DUF3488 and transglutaminase-like domain-containing protein [Gulosibacter chungangensis]|uniref:Transglutaminase-like domain-containing protein n=1 Tax=Gulosibacter chungangensis TaxID=979746 RepID=A0A7J5BAX5_9MICO|nr:DUF3488 and transglutaminase-like domain-containing protein [Gulosibacter chungangensis]KAB1642604.1 hypothetical protein F8O05_09030 [Gulosibacter chungangensis]
MKDRGSWNVTIGLMLLMCSGILLATPIVGTNAWLLPAMITIVVLLAITQASRQFTNSRVLSVVIGLITLAVAGIVLAQPTGVGDVFTAVGRQLSTLAEQLPSDQPPLRETPATIYVLSLSAGLLALVADLLANVLRAPAAAMVAVAPMVAVPIAVGLPAADWWAWILFAAIAVFYLYLGYRWLKQVEDDERTSAGFSVEGRGLGGFFGAAATGGVTVLVALLIAVLAPGPSGLWWNALGANSSISTNRVNPIIDLGDDLRRNDPIEVLRYATSQTEGQLPYLSLVTLSTFSADTEWQPAEFASSRSAVGDDLPLPSQLANQPNVITVNTNVVIEQGVSAYLPLPSSPLRLGAVEGEYGWDSTTGSIRNLEDEALAQSFHVDSVLPRPTEEEISSRTAPTSDDFAQFLTLPDDPALEQIRAVMNEVIDPNASAYEQALELQAWFTGGAFDYSELAPVSGGYDGTGLEVINEFLSTRSGYCVHFSSAMAVMGRLLGIPTRIQVGFTPGTFASVNDIGQPVYSVTTDNLHSWAEFWVEGYGWVPFETTPSSGIGETNVAEIQDEGETAPEPEDTVAPIPTEAPEDATSEPEPTEEAETPEPTGADGQTENDGAGFVWTGTTVLTLVVVLLLLILAAVALAPRFLRARIRKQREQAVAAAAPEAAEAAWQELLDTATDLRLRLPRGRTTGMLSARLATLIGLEPGDNAAYALRRLGEALDAATFSDPENPQAHPVAWQDVELVRDGMLEHASDADVRRATWFPASIVSQVRARGARKRGRG